MSNTTATCNEPEGKVRRDVSALPSHTLKWPYPFSGPSRILTLRRMFSSFARNAPCEVAHIRLSYVRPDCFMCGTHETVTARISCADALALPPHEFLVRTECPCHARILKLLIPSSGQSHAHIPEVARATQILLRWPEPYTYPSRG